MSKGNDVEAKEDDVTSLLKATQFDIGRKASPPSAWESAASTGRDNCKERPLPSLGVGEGPTHDSSTTPPLWVREGEDVLKFIIPERANESKTAYTSGLYNWRSSIT